MSSPWFISLILTRERRIEEIMLLVAFLIIAMDLSAVTLTGNVSLALFMETLILLGFIPIAYGEFKKCFELLHCKNCEKNRSLTLIGDEKSEMLEILRR
jgi:hypothetical protein